MRDRVRLRALLRRDPALHVYELGDLDDFFWPHTTWYVRDDAVALLYAPPSHAVLAAFAHDHDREALAALLDEIELPLRLHTHTSPGLIEILARRYAIGSRVEHLKMALTDRTRLSGGEGEPLGPQHRAELETFYARSYPGNWFDPRMLETGHYVALRTEGAIVAAAGVHVYSASERVAALGNIATDPALRGGGLAARVTARLCTTLSDTVDVIGLNVKATNVAAIRCYERLGFATIARFDECTLVAHGRL
jgi:ribosomal protein S18 acetylase RimI-like enzyme